MLPVECSYTLIQGNDVVTSLMQAFKMQFNATTTTKTPVWILRILN